ncbi:MAG: G/T mismatches repair enzyme [Methanoregula sp. PtaU1.Bin051]|nr:MAG: G/T mismatches repair enzyme [Methanoregula sp. PtaU1.Bin051]
MTRNSGNQVYNKDQAGRFHELLKSEGVSPKVISRFRKIILTFYKKSGRDLPWRQTTNPYHILVSEIMLQQTRVDRVIKKFPEFIAVYPTCFDLARAKLPELLSVWQGMGYNRRAIALSGCARMIVERYDGQVPRDPEILALFPGIGNATAHSIAAFAFNEPVVFIETNIRRIFIHFFFAGRDTVADRDILPLVTKTLD